MRASGTGLVMSSAFVLALITCAGGPDTAAAQSADGPSAAASAAPAKQTAQKPAKTAAASKSEKTTKAPPTETSSTGKQAAATPDTAGKPSAATSGKKKGSQSIVALVGDDPITAYEIEQRQRLMSQSSAVGKEAQARFQSLIRSDATKQKMEALQKQIIADNPGKSRDELIAMIKLRVQAYAKELQQQALAGVRSGAMAGLRQKAIDQLIDERLMVQEAKRVGVLATEEEVDKALAEKAQRNKMTLQENIAQFKSAGIDFETLRATYRAQMSWRDVIGRKFGHQIQVTGREVDQIVSTRPQDVDEDVELKLQKLTLPVPAKLDQKIMAQRFQEAETIWRQFKDCASLAALSASVAGARLENLGQLKAGAIPEPTRGLLLSAADGSMIPPTMGAAGMELWAVCGRTIVKADDKKRQEAEVEIRREQFGLLADRHLKDLRKDTPVEYR